jgi:hypothetical protein
MLDFRILIPTKNNISCKNMHQNYHNILFFSLGNDNLPTKGLEVDDDVSFFYSFFSPNESAASRYFSLLQEWCTLTIDLMLSHQ